MVLSLQRQEVEALAESAAAHKMARKNRRLTTGRQNPISFAPLAKARPAAAVNPVMVSAFLRAPFSLSESAWPPICYSRFRVDPLRMVKWLVAKNDLLSVAALRARNPETLNALVTENLPTLLAGALAIGLSRPDAEEVVQDTFVAFLSGWTDSRAAPAYGSIFSGFFIIRRRT